MRHIYFRPVDSPPGTPFKEGWAYEEGGGFIRIGSYNGDPHAVLYKKDELEIVDAR